MLCLYLENHLINTLLSVRRVALSGWMDPTGAMLIGCQGSPTTQQLWRTVWKCWVGVRLLFKAELKAHRHFFVLPLCYVNSENWPVGHWVSDLLFVFQGMESSTTSHAGNLRLSSAPILISECTVSSFPICFFVWFDVGWKVCCFFLQLYSKSYLAKQMDQRHTMT